MSSEGMSLGKYRRNAHSFGFGPCEFCGRSARLIAEHCHEHGWIRGRACESCNQGISHAERRSTLAELAAGACKHEHRSETAAERCRARNHRANSRLVAWLSRCADCAATLEVPAIR